MPISSFLVLFVVAVCAFLGNTAISVARRASWFRRSGITIDATPLLLVVRETWAVLVVLTWRLLRRGRRLDRRAPASNHDVVVLVHGMWADGTSMWGLRRALSGLGRSTLAPDIGRRGDTLGAWGDDIAEALGACEGAVDVVCHSLGGVALRVALTHRPWLRERIRSVSLLAVPDDGTGAADGIPMRIARDMRRGSAFLASLPALDVLVPRADVLRVISRHDPIVYPAADADVLLEGFGHAELLTHRGVRAIIIDHVMTRSGSTVAPPSGRMMIDTA